MFLEYYCRPIEENVKLYFILLNHIKHILYKKLIFQKLASHSISLAGTGPVKICVFSLQGRLAECLVANLFEFDCAGVKTAGG